MLRCSEFRLPAGIRHPVSALSSRTCEDDANFALTTAPARVEHQTMKKISLAPSCSRPPHPVRQTFKCRLKIIASKNHPDTEIEGNRQWLNRSPPTAKSISCGTTDAKGWISRRRSVRISEGGLDRRLKVDETNGASSMAECGRADWKGTTEGAAEISLTSSKFQGQSLFPFMGLTEAPRNYQGVVRDRGQRQPQ